MLEFPAARYTRITERRQQMPQQTAHKTDFLWLEITGKCQLQCTHCYAQSGPSGTHGAMTARDWFSVIDQAADLGVSMAQLIGGEPTMHPQFAALLRHAVSAGLAVEVYTNLVHVKDSWWDLFACPNVSLATSYYSDSPREHDAMTRRAGSHARTRANIAEAVRRGIPLRAGIIAAGDGQAAGRARDELAALGITRMGTDRVRQVGRGGTPGGPEAAELCGHCGRGVAAISPHGDVWPCVFSRWLPAGNVLRAPLADILAGPLMSQAVAQIPARDITPDGASMCVPRACNPNRPCGPDSNDGCRPKSCAPAR
jgi:MoaA/NifB/PqqE/SkfB family radical SAM enzyme